MRFGNARCTIQMRPALLAFAPRENLADLACGAGYADQAHICRDFRDLARTTPQSLLTRVGSTLSMSDLFNTEDGDND